MPELRTYTCDGACGTSVTLDGPNDGTVHMKWFTTYTPAGYPNPKLYACSKACLIRALRGVEQPHHA